MTTNSLIYFVPVYLFLVLGVVLVASHRRIALFKAFLISFFFTPVIGIVALCRVSKKVVVTYYNPINKCAHCPYVDDPEQEVCERCEFMGQLREKLSVNRRYSV
jgi:uncharacterized paraquat-inducible protein A